MIEITTQYLDSQGLSHTFPERFWSKVDKDGPVPPHRPELGQCWVWTARKHKFGYGEINKGRHPTMAKKGEANHRHKLTTEQVIKIRELAILPEFEWSSVALKFGVSVETVHDVASWKTWKHVSMPFDKTGQHHEAMHKDDNP